VADDTAAVAAGLRRVAEERRDARPGDAAPIEFTYQDALLWAKIGDTTSARRTLDLSLDALATVDAHLLERVQSAGSLVRAMILRAELGARSGEAASARRWSSAVVDLWSGADPELQSAVARMRALADASPR
jgi:hypothetical protein